MAELAPARATENGSRAAAREDEPVDRLGRRLRDLRVSVTDRCTFRCPYCMPKEVFGRSYTFLPRAEILSFEELTRVVAAAASLGVTKVRLTGGEPLLRRDLEVLVSLVASTPGITDVALTTNGSLLAAHAQSLRNAGLHRVTVSLDSLDPTVFAAMGDTKVPLSKVLDGIAAAAAAGLAPIKLNTVLRRGMNEAGLLDLVEFARDGGYVLRCIEYMDVGNTNGWNRSEVVTSAEVLDRISAVHPVEPVAPARPGEVAQRWRYLDGRGEFGLISSVSTPFCSTCTRARLTAVGELYTCLFAAHGRDLRGLLRGGVDDDALHAAIAAAWGARDDRYSELRGLSTVDLPKPEMSYLGG
jgi:GTP 3',8-cyclase